MVCRSHLQGRLPSRDAREAWPPAACLHCRGESRALWLQRFLRAELLFCSLRVRGLLMAEHPQLPCTDEDLALHLRRAHCQDKIGHCGGTGSRLAAAGRQRGQRWRQRRRQQQQLRAQAGRPRGTHGWPPSHELAERCWLPHRRAARRGVGGDWLARRALRPGEAAALRAEEVLAQRRHPHHRGRHGLPRRRGPAACGAAPGRVPPRPGCRPAASHARGRGRARVLLVDLSGQL
mmetsp:Transcript_44009/g.127276  ORF Transcript_44009/g.127276 Transcript_44009/m.127276 type:complete len:234 (+) Transcript_44009:740-1441(+)